MPPLAFIKSWAGKRGTARMSPGKSRRPPPSPARLWLLICLSDTRTQTPRPSGPGLGLAQSARPRAPSLAIFGLSRASAYGPRPTATAGKDSQICKLQTR